MEYSFKRTECGKYSVYEDGKHVGYMLMNVLKAPAMFFTRM